MNIRDSVKSAENKVSSEAQSLSEFVKDPAHTLIDRLEAFHDIMNMEIGDTRMSRSKAFEREFQVRQMYIKFEGDNPTGTQKDRIAFAQVYDALRREYEAISLATCGNYGVAVALAAKLAGIECKIFIPENYHTDRGHEMQSLNAEIIRSPGTYEDAVQQSIAIAAEKGWYDANPGGLNAPIQIAAYSEISMEIYDQLRDAPKYCAVPVSNGTLLAGVYRGFVSLFKRGKTSRIPRMIAASSTFKNPIIQSYNRGLDFCMDLKPEDIKETRINEPLINWHSFDGEEALYALRKSEGKAFNISDKSMKDMSSFILKMEGYRILPASTAGLIGMLRWHEKEPFEPDRYVSIITAKH